MMEPDDNDEYHIYDQDGRELLEKAENNVKLKEYHEMMRRESGGK